MIRKFLAALAVMALVVVGLVAISAPVSAHTPSVSATCDTLSVDLTNYQIRDAVAEQSHTDYEYVTYKLNGDVKDTRWAHKDDGPSIWYDWKLWFRTGETQKHVTVEAVPQALNHVKITIGGVVKDSVKFGTLFSDTYPIAPAWVAHSWSVVVTAWDDPTGSKGWTKTFSGTTVPCIPEQPKDKTRTDTFDTPPSCDNPEVTMGSVSYKQTTVFNNDTGKWDWQDEVITEDTRKTVTLSEEDAAYCDPYVTVVAESLTCGTADITVAHNTRWQYGVTATVDGKIVGSNLVKDIGSDTIKLNFSEDQGDGQVTVKYYFTDATEWDYVPSDLRVARPYGENIGSVYKTILVDTDCIEEGPPTDDDPPIDEGEVPATDEEPSTVTQTSLAETGFPLLGALGLAGAFSLIGGGLVNARRLARKSA